MSQTTDNASNDIIITGWQKILYSMLTAWAAWGSIVLFQQSQRLTIIENTYITIEEENKNLKELLKHVNQSFPPQWIINDIEDNTVKILNIENNIIVAINKVERKLENKIDEAVKKLERELKNKTDAL